VYKLIAVGDNSSPTVWTPRVKLSAQPEKMTNPGMKRVVRLLRNNFIVADIITLPDEVIEPGHRFIGINPNNPSQQTVYENFDAVETLHVSIFENGKLVYEPPDLKQVKAYAKSRIKTIRLESRRLENPHTIKVSLTEPYFHYKQTVIKEVRTVQANSLNDHS
jgi:nicotinate phosphoribosyltransferase